jgi:hypothetical protein
MLIKGPNLIYISSRSKCLHRDYQAGDNYTHDRPPLISAQVGDLYFLSNVTNIHVKINTESVMHILEMDCFFFFLKRALNIIVKQSGILNKASIFLFKGIVCK